MITNLSHVDPAARSLAVERLRRVFVGGNAMVELAAVDWRTGQRRPYSTVDGVALIDVTGLLMNDPDPIDRLFLGATGYNEIRDDVAAAVADPKVLAIALRVNSPGGETDMAFETASEIERANQVKPVVAIVESAAYSAAYLLASAAREIYVTPVSGGVGSIGVYSMHADYSKMLEKDGITVTLISAGTGKVDGNPYEPISDSARATAQVEIDRLYGEFVDAVASRRRISADAIRAFGAQCFHGASSAIAAGLCDYAATSEQAVLTISGKARTGLFATNSKEPNMPDTPAASAADIQAQVAAARSEGFAEAADIVSLCAIAGKPQLANKYLNEGKTAADVRRDLQAAIATADEAMVTTSQVLPEAGTTDGQKPKKSLAAKMLEMVNGKEGN
jgi:signal peptide peptidase SppA